MKTVLFMSDRGIQYIPGFFYQWNKYCGLPVTTVGFTRPPGIRGDFVSLGKFSDYPANRWSNALIKYLQSLDDELVTIMLEDYWLISPVDLEVMSIAQAWMEREPNAIRFDLTTDRMNSGNAHRIAFSRKTEILMSFESQYQLSFQASIWNVKNLLKVIIPDETPWQTELNGTMRLNDDHPDLKVFGTTAWPIKYQIVMDKGVFKKDGSWMYPKRQLSDEDFNILERIGYIPHGKL